MNTYRKLSETAIYNIDNLDYDATYQNLRTTPNKNIGSLEKSEKGHITCRFKRPNIFVEISPKGKMNIYYDRYDDVNKITRILWEQKLVVCDRFSIERDVPRTLKGVQEGLKASLDDLIEPELLQRLNYHNYILPTTPPKTFQALAEGIRNYLTELTERLEYNRAVQEMENTTGWVITFGTTVTGSSNYPKACDRLIEELTSALKESSYGFRLYEEDRDGEGLSLRYAFVWSPAANALEFPPYPECWQQLELAPFRSIYPDSDFEDIHRDDDLD